MGAYALGAVAGDGPDLEIDGLEAAAGALDAAEPLVGAHRVCGAEVAGGQAGAEDVEAVELGLLGAALPVAPEGEAVCGDLQVAVLGHLALGDDLAPAQADPIPDGEAAVVAPGGGEDRGEVALSEQGELQHTAQGRGAQGADPVQSGRLDILADPGAGKQAAVADRHHPGESAAGAQLGDLGFPGGEVGGVAVAHLDRHEAALGVAQQAERDPRLGYRSCAVASWERGSSMRAATRAAVSSRWRDGLAASSRSSPRAHQEPSPAATCP